MSSSLSGQSRDKFASLSGSQLVALADEAASRKPRELVELLIQLAYDAFDRDCSLATLPDAP